MKSEIIAPESPHVPRTVDSSTQTPSSSPILIIPNPPVFNFGAEDIEDSNDGFGETKPAPSSQIELLQNKIAALRQVVRTSRITQDEYQKEVAEARNYKRNSANTIQMLLKGLQASQKHLNDQLRCAEKTTDLMGRVLQILPHSTSQSPNRQDDPIPSSSSSSPPKK